MSIVVALLWAIDWAAHAVGGWLVPSGWSFTARLLGDVVDLLVLPFPIVATVLLYVDIRRRREGLDVATLRAQLEPAPPAA